MSHPNPSHDRENEYPHDSMSFHKKSKTRALHKAKEAPLGKLKRLIGESSKGRQDWKSMLGK